MMAAAATLACASSAAVAEEKAYIVDTVTTTIATDEVIGAKRSGLLCLPNGAVRLRTVLPNDKLDQREVVAQALEEAGLNYYRSSSQAARRGTTRYRVKGIVRAAFFDVCDKGGGITGLGYSGKAGIEVVWRVQGFDDGRDDFKLTSQITHLIDKQAAASLGVIYRRLLTDAARNLADRLGRRTAGIREPSETASDGQSGQ